MIGDKRMSEKKEIKKLREENYNKVVEYFIGLTKMSLSDKLLITSCIGSIIVIILVVLLS